MPDHVHLLVSVDPNLAFIADEAGERPFVSFFAPGISCVATKIADLVDELVFGQDKRGSVALAFEAFYRRVAEGQTPGYPRFKSPFRYDSLTFKQYGNSFNLLPGSKKNTGTLVLAKLGQVKMVLHRPIKGTPKRRCSLAPSASSPRPPKGASSERRSARSWPACMSGSGIDGKTLLSKRFANSSNSSGCSRWRRWSCGI